MVPRDEWKNAKWPKTLAVNDRLRARQILDLVEPEAAEYGVNVINGAILAGASRDWLENILDMFALECAVAIRESTLSDADYERYNKIQRVIQGIQAREDW